MTPREMEQEVTRYRTAYEAALRRAQNAEERIKELITVRTELSKRVAVLEKDLTRVKEDNRILRAAALRGEPHDHLRSV